MAERKRVYIAGPYSARTAWEIEQNVRKAEKFALAVNAAGGAALSPHVASRFMMGTLTEADWIAIDLEWLRVAECVLLLPGWGASKGTLREVAEAARLGIPVFKAKVASALAFRLPADFLTWLAEPREDSEGEIEAPCEYCAHEDSESIEPCDNCHFDAALGRFDGYSSKGIVYDVPMVERQQHKSVINRRAKAWFRTALLERLTKADQPAPADVQRLAMETLTAGRRSGILPEAFSVHGLKIDFEDSGEIKVRWVDVPELVPVPAAPPPVFRACEDCEHHALVPSETPCCDCDRFDSPRIGNPSYFVPR